MDKGWTDAIVLLLGNERFPRMDSKMTKPRRVRVFLENDQYILAPKWAIKDLVGIDEFGNLIITETEAPFAGQLTGLTSCCNVTAKGCDGYTGCRNCYREVESYLGAEMRPTDIYLKVKAGA